MFAAYVYSFLTGWETFPSRVYTIIFVFYIVLNVLDSHAV